MYKIRTYIIFLRSPKNKSAAWAKNRERTRNVHENEAEFGLLYASGRRKTTALLYWLLRDFPSNVMRATLV